MGKILSEEERRHMLEKLESKMTATCYMALKFISSSINQDKVDFAKKDMEIPEFTRSLLKIIERLSEKDYDEMVKREAAVCLENLKKKINPILMQDMNMCASCGERVFLSYRFCTTCGVDLKGLKWASYKLCKKCQNAIDPNWNNCSYCGSQLIKKVEVAKPCRFCQKNIEPSWSMCPFCGSRL